jgi:glycosyltransferase involved in cell wall biosynthesis
MPQNPKVSVTIPSYNHARFLAAAIESVLAQTYKNIEVVIVDDGSTDGSFEIAKDYAARYPDIVSVSTHAGHRNRGISATVNRGFELSTGVYWCGLPSDDLLHSHKIAEQVAFLEEHPDIGWVYCYAYYVDENGQRRPEYGFFGEDITKSPDAVEYLLLGNVIPGMTPLMRRDAVAEIEPHDETFVYSDWDFWIRLAARHPVAFQPRARVLYRMHGSNTGFGSEHATNVIRGIPVLQKLKRQATEIGGALERPRTRALIELQLACFTYALQRETESEEYLNVAFETDPTLERDVSYFVRWLGYCHRRFGFERQMNQMTFVEWVVSHLPAGLAQEFKEAVKSAVSGREFKTKPAIWDRLAAHWHSRRITLNSLLNDPIAMHDPELRGFHLEALVGSRFRRGLKLIGPSGRREKPTG